jgi:Holliday junction resolvase RusA-like endonuclease
MTSFIVLGEPKGQPRARAFARGGMVRMYDPGTAEAWKSQVALAWNQCKNKQKHEGPVSIELAFYFKRPKSHFNKAGVKPKAPFYHVAKPDADNAAKAVLDALTQIGAWRDDSQVAELKVSKRYADENTGCFVTIQDLSNSTQN